MQNKIHTATMHNTANNTMNKKSIKLVPLLMALCIAQTSIPLQANKKNSIIGGLIAGAGAIACAVGGTIFGYNYSYNKAESYIKKAQNEQQSCLIQYGHMLRIQEQYGTVHNNATHRSKISNIINTIKKEHASTSYARYKASDHFPLLWYTNKLNDTINCLQNIHTKLISYRSAMQKDAHYYQNISTERHNAEIALTSLLESLNTLHSDIVSTHEYQKERTNLQQQEEYNAVEQFKKTLNNHRHTFESIDNQLSQLRSIYDVSDFIHCLSNIITYQFARITSYPSVYNSTIRDYYPQLWYDNQLQATMLQIQTLNNSLQNAHAPVVGLQYYATQAHLEADYRYLMDRIGNTISILQITQNRLRLSPLYIADLYAYESACIHAEQQARLELEMREERERLDRLERRERERARERERKREERAREYEHRQTLERERERERIRERERAQERERERAQERERERQEQKWTDERADADARLSAKIAENNAKIAAAYPNSQEQERADADARLAAKIAENNAKIAASY